VSEAAATVAGATRFGPYPDYATSGTEWLHDVPSHWKIIRLKSALSLSREKNGKRPVGAMLSVSGYRGVEPKVYDHEEQRRTDDELEDYRVVRPGQLVANTMWLNYSGLGVSEYEGHVSPAYRCYNIGSKYHGPFLHHLMRSSIYVGRYCGLLYGIRPNSLQIKNHDWDSIELLIPPIDEQRAIAHFLDRETSKIDALVAKKQRLIELLQEKRTALITHAVTKGLDPNAPMKPSGIDWLGDIPAHWELQKLKHIAGTQKGFAFKIHLFCERGIPIVKASDLNLGSIRPSTTYIANEQAHAFPKVRLRTGDVILSTVGSKPTVAGSAVGQVAMVPDHLNHALLNQNTVRLDPGPTILSAHLFRVLNSRPFRIYLDLHAHGTANQASLNVADVMDYLVPLPSIGEQRAISDWIQSKELQVERLEDAVRRATGLLKEFRTALISAAVTGKIDVRDTVS